MRFARRIFERHRKRGPARVPVVPHVPFVSPRSRASITHKPIFAQAPIRRSVASAAAWMPMADFGDDSVNPISFHLVPAICLPCESLPVKGQAAHQSPDVYTA